MTNQKEILFGGVGPSAFAGFGSFPPELASFHKPAKHSSVDDAYSKLTSTDEGKRLYGDPEKGATIEQAWRNNGALTGVWPVCLLASERLSGPTDAINRVVKMKPQLLVETLAEMLDLYRYPANVLYHDGYRGHAVAVCKYESKTSLFAYIDSWPGDSLLSKDLNAAGIDAQPRDYLSLQLPDIERPYWTITSKELEKVIVAAFVFPSVWSEHLGEKYYMTYDEFKSSDFWSWFQIKERDTSKTLTGNTVTYLEPGRFQSEVNLLVTLDKKNRVIQGILNLRRDWIIDSRYIPYGLNPFALDIARSFIATIIPHPDRQRISNLIELLRTSEIAKLIHEAQDPDDIIQTLWKGRQNKMSYKALAAYLGTPPAFLQRFDFSDMSLINSKKEEHEWLEIDIRIYVP